jgi:hypothetical protein
MAIYTRKVRYFSAVVSRRLCLEWQKETVLKAALRWVSQTAPTLAHSVPEMQSLKKILSLLRINVTRCFCYGMQEQRKCIGQGAILRLNGTERDVLHERLTKIDRTTCNTVLYEKQVVPFRSVALAQPTFSGPAFHSSSIL